MLISEVVSTLLYVAGTTGSVLIRELGVPNSEVLNREVPLYLDSGRLLEG